jgi:hypothetical protein
MTDARFSVYASGIMNGSFFTEVIFLKKKIVTQKTLFFAIVLYHES